MSNVFDKYLPKESTHYVEALGAEVTIKALTIGESEELRFFAVKGLDSEGKPDVDMSKLSEARLRKVSLMLVNPAMSPKDLKALGSDADEAISEILTLADTEDEDLSVEGN